MNISISARYALSVCATVVMLAGCGGGSQSQPAVPSEAMQNTAQSGLNAQLLGRPRLPNLARPMTSVHPDHRRSWMAPDAVKTQQLLYVSDQGNGDIYVFTYHQTKRVGKLRGTLTGFDQPQGLCVNQKGQVWITLPYQSEIVEYAHGGAKPIATLSDPNEYPVGCSVDPTTGDLAVVNVFGGGAAGNVAIYANAQGTPTVYSDPEIFFMDNITYDNAGNIFVDGSQTDGSGFVFAELPKGSSTFVNPTLNQPIGAPGGVAWDGTYVAVEDEIANIIYQVQVSGSSATVTGSTPLTGAKEIGQFWIQNARVNGKTMSRVIGPDADNADVGFWKYPAGGTASQTFTGLDSPYGAAVSIRVRKDGK